MFKNIQIWTRFNVAFIPTDICLKIWSNRYLYSHCLHWRRIFAIGERA